MQKAKLSKVQLHPSSNSQARAAGGKAELQAPTQGQVQAPHTAMDMPAAAAAP